MDEPEQAPLAAAIQRVRERYGSHDKFAAALRERDSTLGASRAGLISWEKTTVPSAKYRPTLIAMGVPAELFPAKAIRRRRATTEEEVGHLTRAVVALLRLGTVLSRQVEELGGTVPADLNEELAQAALHMRPRAQTL